ncbi:hypothetical protein AP213_22985 [Escherichia coli]|nr:hypothetical protein AP213_22985 [Escherichia coli]
MHDRRMRRKRLIQPTKPAPIVGMIRRASVASGISARTPDAASTPYPAYRTRTDCRHDKTRKRRIRHQRTNALFA